MQNPQYSVAKGSPIFAVLLTLVQSNDFIKGYPVIVLP